MAISELKEIKIYLNCENMLKRHMFKVYKSKYCKKCEKKWNYCKKKMIVRFHMDFKSDGKIEIYDKLIYDWKLEEIKTTNTELGSRICGRCRGEGYIYYYEHVESGICFACDGTGRV